MGDLVGEVGGKLVEVPDRFPQRVAVRHRDDLGVGAVLVGHPEDPERPRFHQAARKGRLVEEDEGVERVTVLGQRVGHEPVVGRVEGRREEPSVEPDDVALVVVLVLVAAPPGDLHDHVDELVVLHHAS